MASLEPLPRLTYQVKLSAPSGDGTVVAEIPHEAFVAYLGEQLQLGVSIEVALLGVKEAARKQLARGR